MSGERTPVVAFCQLTWSGDYSLTLEQVRRAAPYVDHIIVVEEGDLAEEQRRALTAASPKVRLLVHPLREELGGFPGARNAYLEEARRLGADWVLTPDADEFPCEELLKDLKALIRWAEENGYNMLCVNCRERFRDVEWLDSLDLLKETPGGYRESNFYKCIIFRLYPDARYEGVGRTKTVHETLLPHDRWRAVNLPKGKYWYEHRKSALRIWRNAARNMFLGGGGNNVGALNPFWVELRQICGKLGIRSWREFEELLERGRAPEELKAWLLKALWASPTDWGVETRQTAKLYYALHPDEITPEVEYRLRNPPRLTPEEEVRAYIKKAYFDVLGRHPDEEGLEHYARAILEGRMRREDLPRVLAASREFRERWGVPTPVETTRVRVPVNVDIGLTEQVILRAITRSKLWREGLREQLELARKFQAYLAIQRKAETGGRGIDHPDEAAVERYVRRCLEFMPPEDYPRLLDVGAGDGYETKRLMDVGYEVVGITLGEDNVRTALERYGVHLNAIDMHNLPFPEGYFDCAVVCHTLEHALAPHMVVGELRWVLRDGGRVYVVVPDPTRPEMKTVWHLSLMTREQVVDLFRYWGFRLVWSEGYEFVFEKLPADHPDFRHQWGYLKHVYEARKKAILEG